MIYLVMPDQTVKTYCEYQDWCKEVKDMNYGGRNSFAVHPDNNDLIRWDEIHRKWMYLPDRRFLGE